MAVKVLKQGKVPKHISFIMDGNRRFAKNQHHKAFSGHEEGTKTLKKSLLYWL
jgi:ditrans,polycis-polyprenyl diphosphate synthase